MNNKDGVQLSIILSKSNSMSIRSGVTKCLPFQ